MRRRRYQQGSLKKRCGKWIGQWWEQGRRRNRALGPVSSMTKSKAREALDHILGALPGNQPERPEQSLFGPFVAEVYYPFYRRKWKVSTAMNNVNRVDVHLVSAYAQRPLAGISRDELQDLLDQKAAKLSASMVAHLRWDLKQIFDMAVAEGLIPRNPASLLFVPKEAKREERLVMTIEEVQVCFCALDRRERLIAKLATLAGMRPGEILALRWERLTATHAEITERVYRGRFDSPKTNQSVRKAALTDGLLAEIEEWRALAVDRRKGALVFPSENPSMPLSRDNCFRRCIAPRLAAVGLSWVTFQVMRRTHSSLMNALGVEGKLVADQLGHSLDVNQNVYTQTSVDLRRTAVQKLESAVQIA